MKFRPAFAVLSVTLAIGACGELPFKKDAEPEAAGHTGPPGVSPIDQPIETGTETKAVSTAEASTMNTAIFRAVAADGSWTVHAADKTAVYARPGQRSLGVTTRRITYAGGVEFVGTMSNRPFTLNVSATECRTASGERFPMTARLSANGARSTGCAGAATEMPKADAKAPGAAPRKAATTRKPAATTPTATETKPAVTETTPTTSTTTPSTTTPATPAPSGTVTSTPLPDAPSTTTTPSTPVPSTTTTPSTTTPTVTPSTTTTTPAAPAAPAAPATPAPSTPAPSTTAPTVTPPVVLPKADTEKPAE